MTLNTLALSEAEIAKALDAIGANPDERNSAIVGRGLDVAYRDVLDEYLALIAHNPNDVEATKRALFLAWYACAEPTELSGLGAVTSSQIDAAISYADRSLAEHRDDPELMAIIAHCSVILDSPFAGLSPRAGMRLSAFMRSGADYRRAIRIPADPWTRGQLGFYFGSMSARAF